MTVAVSLFDYVNLGMGDPIHPILMRRMLRMKMTWNVMSKKMALKTEKPTWMTCSIIGHGASFFWLCCLTLAGTLFHRCYLRHHYPPLTVGPQLGHYRRSRCFQGFHRLRRCHCRFHLLRICQMMSYYQRQHVQMALTHHHHHGQIHLNSSPPERPQGGRGVQPR